MGQKNRRWPVQVRLDRPSRHGGEWDLHQGRSGPSSPAQQIELQFKIGGLPFGTARILTVYIVARDWALPEPQPRHHRGSVAPEGPAIAADAVGRQPAFPLASCSGIASASPQGPLLGSTRGTVPQIS